MSQAAASPARLLVVEDDPDILEPIQGVLEEEGYCVTTALSLPASLALVSQQIYQLVLTDLFSSQGHNPLQSIRPLLTQAAPTPVGVMTAWHVTREAAAQAGLAWVLQKPFNLNELLRAVQREVHPRYSRTRQTQVVEQFVAALNSRDWKQVARLCTSDVVIQSLSAPPIATSANHFTLSHYRTILEQGLLALPGFTFEQVSVFARPVGLAARYLVRWQSSDGTAHRVAGAMHFRFKGERISQIEGAF